MKDQQEAWDSFYSERNRPWRGTSQLNVPFGSGQHILDVGCGNGKTSAALLEMGCTVTGVDISQNAVNQCSEALKMNAVCSSCTKLPFGNKEFDGIVFVHVLEHLTDDEINDTMKEAERVLNDDGLVFLRVFTKDDMRSQNSDVRNGILYRYFDESEVKGILSEFSVVRMETITQRTKFGTVRSRIEVLFRKK